jgi:acetyl-CoA acyltransferase
MAEAFIIDGIRTPIGTIGGALAEVRPDDMAARVIAEVMRRNPGVDPARVADVVLGCANQAGEDNRNVARMSALLSGLPVTVPGETVNRLCASGMSAVVNAARAIRLDEGDVYVAGGVESMTRAPYVLSKSKSAWGRDAEMFDTSLGWRFVNPRMREAWGVDNMGQTAENVAETFKVSREDQDRFAAWSQKKTAEAKSAGYFDEEILPVEIAQKKGDPVKVAEDEHPRQGTTEQVLAKLRTVFREGGSVTAGNSSGLNDGAVAMLITSEVVARELTLTPLARVVTSAAVGVEPRIMGIGPVEASKLALRRAGLAIEQMDVIEINEAFAAQVLACLRELGVPDDDPRVNPNGGAIAIGHPLGMTGARLALTAARQLNRTGGRYALVTMCVGVGQGMAAVLERV